MNALEEIKMDRFKDRASRGVFTEVHIAKLTNLPIKLEAETQTEPYVQKKQLRFPMKESTGVDISVQVIESEIFDFDRESAPMVKVLVNRILEEAKLEAWNEGETEYLKKHKIFMDQKEAERLQKMRDFEKNERAKRDKAIELKVQRTQRKKVLKETHRKLIGRELSKNYVKIIHKQVAKQVANMAFKKEEKASDQIQNVILAEVEDLIYQQIGQKEQIQKLLLKMFNDAKKVFTERFMVGKGKYEE